MSIDITPPVEIVEFAQQQGFENVIFNRHLSNRKQQIYQLYKNKEKIIINDDEIPVFTFIYLIKTKNNLKFATDEEILIFIKKN